MEKTIPFEIQIRDDIKAGFYLAVDGHFFSLERGCLDDVKPTRFRNVAVAKLAAKDGQRVVEVA